jgi:hypothetical protein
MENKSTPEDKLLNLIRNKGKEVSGLADTLAKQPIASQVSKAAGKKCGPVFLSQGLKILSLKKINIALVGVIVFFLVYIIFESVFSKEYKPEQLNKPDKTNLNKEAKESALPETKSFDFYSEKLNKRDIFKPETGSEQGGSFSSTTALSEQVANLRLAGIIVDKQPQAIIEDTKLKKTYFLYKGDFIGEIKVEDILEGKVILGIGDEKVELIP